MLNVFLLSIKRAFIYKYKEKQTKPIFLAFNGTCASVDLTLSFVLLRDQSHITHMNLGMCNTTVNFSSTSR